MCEVYIFNLKNKSSSFRVVEWSKAPASGAIDWGLEPDGNVYSHFEFFAYFPFLLARQSLYRQQKIYSK